MTDICRQPYIKQILWRNGISILVSQVYEILIAASESFDVGNPSYCEVQKNDYSLLNFEVVAELDLILRKNKEARSLDVDHFHDIFRTDNDDQILKVLKLSVASGNIIIEHTTTGIRYLGFQGNSFRKPLLHCIRCDFL